MTDAGAPADGIANDSNFLKLAADKTGAEEFTALVDTYLCGYSQKKLVADALKELVKKVEEAELKQSYAKNLGKRKGLEEHETILVNLYSTHDLKEKIQVLNNQIQAMIDEGQITHEEKLKVLDNLRARLEAAKTAGKEKLQEKLQNNIANVSKAGAYVLEVRNLKELSALHRQLDAIHAIEKRPVKAHTPSDKELLGKKADIQGSLLNLEERSRMWFESEAAFKPRLQKALEALAVAEADQRRREEEEAFERQRREEEEAIERRRLEALAKEEAKHKQMLAKLEAKRAEEALKPQKPAVQQAKPKEKKKEKRVNPQAFFVHHRSTLADAEAAEAAAAEEEEWREPDIDEDDEEEQQPATAPPAAPSKSSSSAAPASSSAPSAPAAAPLNGGYPAPAAPPASVQAAAEPPKAAPVAPKKKEKVVLENKWGTDVAPVSGAAAGGEADEEQTSDSALPSLAEAVKASATSAKKAPPPQPKKKDKKKFTKIAATDLGFDANNPNYVNDRFRFKASVDSQGLG
eukprot:CAMPEP_0176061492 /NCGR_PEP_ID=MMETSP0120_2-20121206/30657_1 /TAXON_ID=160619 /ORGANISM="Kryptoperidinium foliaceum, Strain CCMP 1326" /LENGTH=518 /DNA_ID=CAMNT_0017395047 /DNA_START=71 /DNA_END=1624 /DNA_ORIENTATION=-